VIINYVLIFATPRHRPPRKETITLHLVLLSWYTGAYCP